MRRFGQMTMAGLLGALALCASPRQARADLEFVFDAAVSNPLAGKYVYSLQFNSGTVNGTASESLVSGNYATLYDVAGLTSAVISGSNLSPSIQATGLTPPDVSPPDSPAIFNVTITYTGATLTGDATFNDVLTVFSTDTSTVLGYYSGQTTKATNDTLIGSVGLVAVPGAVPAPPSVILMGLGGLGTGLASIRRKLRRRA